MPNLLSLLLFNNFISKRQAFLSFVSSNQKAPYSNYILLGVNQYFANNSLQISIYKVNKDISVWLSSASVEPERERFWKLEPSPAGWGILFWLCWRKNPVGAPGYLALQDSVSLFSFFFINIKIVR